MPAEDMDMQMRHFLMAMPTDVGEQAISGFDQPLGAGDLADCTDKPAISSALALAEKSSQLT